MNYRNNIHLKTFQFIFIFFRQGQLHLRPIPNDILMRKDNKYASDTNPICVQVGGTILIQVGKNDHKIRKLAISFTKTTFLSA